MNNHLRILRAVVLAAAMAGSGLGIIAPTGAAAQSAGACTVSGSASITPGLGVVPTAESYSFSGATGTCVGNSGGPFAGGGACSAGGLVTCVGGTFNLTASSFGSCTGGILIQVGAYAEVHCKTPIGFFWAHVLFVPTPAVQNPVTQVTFTGVAESVTT